MFSLSDNGCDVNHNETVVVMDKEIIHENVTPLMLAVKSGNRQTGDKWQQSVEFLLKQPDIGFVYKIICNVYISLTNIFCFL